MANPRHARDDLSIPTDQVFYEPWSETWFRHEPTYRAFVAVGKARRQPTPNGYHYMWYRFYEDMPKGLVIRPRAALRFCRKISNDEWEWL